MLRAIFQSTLPRGERLAQQYEWDSITVISIHAPTRGATERGRRYFRTTIISIHAPTRGATPCRQKKSSMQIFQSTLPRGERQCCRGKLQLRNEISIHAPTRGATDFLWCLILPFRFQSTLPRGERLVLCSIRSGM